MFEKNGISGGFITLGNIINDDESQKEIKQLSIKMASVGIRVALKEGLQNLYADPEEILDQYKDFDIVKAINERKIDKQGRPVKLLWMRARAIDADTINANGDYFSKEELLKEVEFKDEKIPAYKTFEGVPVYTNHKNDDIELAKGMVVYAEWDEENSCVWTTLFIDEDAYPDIARGIRIGYMHDVSMGCQVEKGKCSICKNIAESEKQYCKHLKNFKGKSDPESGEKVYEENYGLKFIELSIVGDGAFDKCEIASIFDTEEIIAKALELEKKALTLHSSVILAGSFMPKDAIRRQAVDDCLRQVTAMASTSVRLAQAAGTLVGGQLIASEGSGANATVSGILTFLGLDPNAGLNMLDLLNLALNFLEVAVMNLFARKDSIDLAHVGKITKAMAELQQTMQDMIDDGIDTAPAPGGGGTPLNAGQQQPAQAPAAQAPDQQWTPTEGGVGRSMGPGAASAPQANSSVFIPPIMSPSAVGQPSAVGGGAMASTNKYHIVWADTHEDVKIVTASRKIDKPVSRAVKLASQIIELGNDLGVDINLSHANMVPTPIPTKKQPQDIGGNNMEKLFGSRFAAQRRIKEASQLSMDLNTNDAHGHRVTICTDGNVKAFKNDERMDWEPTISEEQLKRMETDDGPAIVANEILKQFREAVTSGHVVKAWQTPTTPEDVTQEQQLGEYSGEAGKRRTPPSDVQEHQLETPRNKSGLNHPEDVQEHQLEKPRTKSGLNHPDDVQEHQIQYDSGLYNPKVTEKDDDVKEALLEDVRKTSPDDVQEHQLEIVRSKVGNAEPKEIMASVVKRLAKVVVSAKLTPEEVIETAERWANKDTFVDMVALARMGNKHRKTIADRRKFHNEPPIKLTITSALFDSFGKESNITAVEFVDGVKVAVSDKEATTNAIKKSVAKLKENDTYTIKTQSHSKNNMLKAALTSLAGQDSEHIEKDHLRAVLSAIAMSSNELRVHPKEVIAELTDIDASEISLARTQEAIKERKTLRARSEFWGDTRTASNKDDIRNNIVGWLADYAVAYKFSSNDLTNATQKIAQQDLAAEKLVNNIIENQRLAAIQFVDEKTTTKRLTCNASDLGIDIKDENLEQTFRDKAIQILSSEGYQVDPATFSITDLNIMSDGNITASVTTRFSKSFDVATPDVTAETTDVVMPSPETDITMTPQSTMTNEVMPENILPPDTMTESEPDPETIMTAAAKQARQAERNKVLQRYAQAAPGMGGAGAPPMGGAMGGMNAPMGLPNTAPMAGGDDLGVSALTGGTEDAPMADGLDTDIMPEPGTKKPWGTICPQCGSEDVDVANGEGKCNSCSANLAYTFQVAVKPASEKEVDTSSPAPAEELPMPEGDMGLGAGTAPAPAPAGGAATPGLGVPPAAGPMASNNNKMVRSAMIMAKASWICDPEVFVKVAAEGFNKKTELMLPVGMVCPGCGNRNANKHKNKTYCHNCGTIAVSSISKTKNNPTKLRASIVWI